MRFVRWIFEIEWSWRARAERLWSAFVRPDNCEFCLGVKGGERGNENREKASFATGRHVVVCDDCSVLLYVIRKRATA